MPRTVSGREDRHQRTPWTPRDTEPIVDAGIRELLAGEAVHELVGLSCLADGADELFARAVLDVGGQLEVIVPAEQYPVRALSGVMGDLLRAVHESGLRRRARPCRIDRAVALDASRTMLDSAEQLYAVWDGRPARGSGGTADVVALAHDLGIDVRVTWPDGATRDN